jgi:hypothetical protein
MSNVKAKPSDLIALCGVIAPQSNAAAATKTTGYVDASLFESFLATISIGAVTATGLVDAKIVQATDTSGTSKKDVTGKAITQASVSNKQPQIEIFSEELDGENGFTFFAIEVTNTTAAAIISVEIYGVNPRYIPASGNDVSSVTEIIS